MPDPISSAEVGSGPEIAGPSRISTFEFSEAARYRRPGDPNQDSAVVDTGHNLVILADGVGGMPGGGKASREAAATSLEYLQSQLRPGTSQEQVFRAMDYAMHLASTAAYGGATTLDLLHVWNGVEDGRQQRYLLLATVGDSPVYVLRRDARGKILGLEKVSTDDSVFTPEEQARFDKAKNFGDLSLADANIFLDKRNQITKSIGEGFGGDPHMSKVRLGDYDQVIAVSDFFSDNFATSEIQDVFAQYPDNPQEAINALYLLADSRIRRGHWRAKDDDATIIMIDSAEAASGRRGESTHIKSLVTRQSNPDSRGTTKRQGILSRIASVLGFGSNKESTSGLSERPSDAVLRETVVEPASRPSSDIEIPHESPQEESRAILKLIAEGNFDFEEADRLAAESSKETWGVIENYNQFKTALGQWVAQSETHFNTIPEDIRRDLLAVYKKLGVVMEDPETHEEKVNWRQFRDRYVVVNGDFNSRMFLRAVNNDPDIVNRPDLVWIISGAFGKGANLMFENDESGGRRLIDATEAFGARATDGGTSSSDQ